MKKSKVIRELRKRVMLLEKEVAILKSAHEINALSSSMDVREAKNTAIAKQAIGVDVGPSSVYDCTNRVTADENGNVLIDGEPLQAFSPLFEGVPRRGEKIEKLTASPGAFSQEELKELEELGFAFISEGNGRINYIFPEKADLTIYPEINGSELRVYPWEDNDDSVVYKNILTVGGIRRILLRHKLISPSSWPKTFKL